MAIKKHFKMNMAQSKHDCTEEQFQDMWDAQKGLCVICDSKMKPTGSGKGCVHVDHCHITGQIRGLLCRECNLGLGHFKDSPGLLKSASNYLDNYRKTSYRWKLYQG